MTPADLKSVRKSLGLSQAEFARVVGAASDRTVRRWEDGEREIPLHVYIMLDLITHIAGVRQRLGISKFPARYTNGPQGGNLGGRKVW